MGRKIGVRKVEKDKATLNDGSIMMMRNGADLLEAYHEAVYDYLLSGKTSKTNPISGFVKAGFEKTEANSIATLEHAVKDTSEYFASKDNDKEFTEYKLAKNLFSWQKELLIDPSKRITLLCGRRSGKSYAEAAVAVEHCIDGYIEVDDNGKKYRKYRKVAMIGLTCQKCVDVFWQNVKDFANISGMKYTADNSNYNLKFINGATISLFGNSSKAEREKIRGSEYSLVIVDEAQSQNGLNYLMTDILGPLIKGVDGSIIMSGTGSLTGYGFWADITTGDNCQNWKHYTATMKDNPTIPNHEVVLKQVLEENGWTEDNITYQREYLAKNIIDTTRMVFPKVHYASPPNNFIATGCYVGVDYGFSDSNAFAPIVWDNEGHIYCVGERKFNKADVTTIVKNAQEVRDFILNTYKVEPRFIADNSDQSISKEIWNRGVKISNAYKVDMTQQIYNLRDYLENGTVCISKGGFIDQECKQTVWKWDDEKKCVIYEIDDDYFHPDILHALRYAVNTYRAQYRK